MANSVEQVKQEELKVVHESYEKYRGAGIALMATVIGLSTGAYYLLRADRPEIAFPFLTSVELAILQQFCDYLGGLYRARSLLNWFYNELEEFGFNKPTSDNLFMFSEALCFLTILSFCINGIYAVSELGHEHATVALALILGVVFVIIVGIWFYFQCWGRWKVKRENKAVLTRHEKRKRDAETRSQKRDGG